MKKHEKTETHETHFNLVCKELILNRHNSIFPLQSQREQIQFQLSQFPLYMIQQEKAQICVNVHTPLTSWSSGQSPLCAWTVFFHVPQGPFLHSFFLWLLSSHTYSDTRRKWQQTCIFCKMWQCIFAIHTPQKHVYCHLPAYSFRMQKSQDWCGSRTLEHKQVL